MAALVSFLVAWGHLLIGLSLLVGLMVRVSATVGAVLMVLYWAAYMDFPHVGGADNFVIDFHFVYAMILVFLVAARAGHVLGLDAGRRGGARAASRGGRFSLEPPGLAATARLDLHQARPVHTRRLLQAGTPVALR